MEEQIKEFTEQLKQAVTRFYEQTGAKAVDINVRISPYEISHKIGLEFYECENRDACRPVPGCGPACHD